MAPSHPLPLGRYQPGSSGLYRLDPRTKLLAGVTLLVALFWPQRSWSALWVAPWLWVGGGLSGVPLWHPFRGLRVFAWLFLGTGLLHGLVTPGTVLLEVPFTTLALTWQGLGRGVVVVSQLATAIALSAVLTRTTAPVELGRGLYRLTSPLQRLGVPLHEFGVVVFLALRFFPILLREVQHLGRAPGSAAGRGLVQRLRRGGELLSLLLRRVLRRADTLGRALERSGFVLGAEPEAGRAPSWGRGDWLALAGSGLTLVGVVLLGG